MEEVSKKKISVKKILKFILIAIIIFIYSTIIIRSFQSCDSQLVKKIITNDAFLTAYNENPKDFEIRQYGMRDAYIQISDGRMITFDKLYFIPKINQLQISIKYNTDVSSYNEKGKIPFRLYLKDENGNKYEKYFYENTEKFQFGYIRVAFEDIVLIDGDNKKKYTLYVELLNKNGEYDPLCEYKIYSGSEVYKNIKFK